MFERSIIFAVTSLALMLSSPGYSSNVELTKPENLCNQGAVLQIPTALAEVKISEEDWSDVQGAFGRFKNVQLEKSAIETMAQGLSGSRLWAIKHDGQKYVIRLGADFIVGNALNEIKAIKAASDNAYGPYLHYCDEKRNIVILEYINNDMSYVDVKNLRANPIFHGMGAKALSGFHKADLDLSEKTVFQWLDEAEQKLTALGAQSTLLNDEDKEIFHCAKRDIEILFKSFTDDLTAVHHDPNPRNFLMNNDRAWLIDWETVSKDYYIVDLAVFSNFFMYDETRIPSFLEAYYDRPANKVEIAKLQLMRPMAAILHSFWLCSLANVKGVPENMLMVPYMDLKGMVRGGEFKLAAQDNKFTFAASMAREGLRLLKSDEHKQAFDLLSKIQSE